MTPFRFRLQHVLAVRQTQFQMAESECRRAEGRLRELEALHATLEATKSETRNSIARMPVVGGGTLQPLSGWFHWTEGEVVRLVKQEKVLAQELQKRRAVLVEAHRKVRLLEKLQAKGKVEWQAAFDREIEVIAADSFNSRYARERKCTG